jgi:hypothetical protein
MGFNFTLICPILIVQIKYPIKAGSTVESIFFIMAVLPFVGPLPLFQFLDLTHSR